ncbi:nitrilase/cyanide hydratase and apolipoprotein N-acyltransferase [Caballeronia hypogeia]|uniref:Nitrilase/cyanide hydratase and apolipoprotein N-acyltransferase n=1 Tax=Caballeronia hypogeia TaxID=1777140 RepID=A0A158CIX3_9BURK|nr:carbon-nitrogen hydrolase family protein [Caballeronia hypogeia]SAK82318.1 nitrilase/cyanide hydratase and apolipoprotein N-acyltransferase [Caballeronia hypogeia]
MKISVIQMTAGESKVENLAKIERLVEEVVARDRPDLVALPEMIAFICGETERMADSGELFPGGDLFDAFSAIAKRHSINFLAGSAMESAGAENRVFNCALLFDRQGELVTKYRKMHRFDAVLPNGMELKESDFVDAGNDVVCVEVEGIKLGLSICYDLRFPELYRALADAGADVIFAPSAFQFQTGADHWEILLRARAIETQCYVVAPDQVGSFGGGKYSMWGHSMIVDPWGTVVAQVSNVEGSATATVDTKLIGNVRARIPVRQHRRLNQPKTEG